MSGFKITSGKGFHITFDNGWTVSVQFGAANYCSGRDTDRYMSVSGEDLEALDREHGHFGSRSAEVAAWGPDGKLIEIESDTVAGWKDPTWVLAFMNEIAAKPSATHPAKEG